MFGIKETVKGYTIQTYFLYCYAIFISEYIMHQRGDVTFGTPCISESRKPTGCMPSIITQFRSRFTDFVFNAILTDFTYMYLVHRKESRERPFCCQSGVCFFMAFSSFNFSIISYKPITVMKLYSLFTYGEAPWSSG